ncbi:sensor histidine kinase [Isobaculum melis]|nr:HAMP domain-containing sensor histidine kinase [Isobaculum melis]
MKRIFKDRFIWVMTPIYLLVICLLVWLIYSLPAIYNQIDTNRVEEIREDITQIIQREEPDDLEEKLADYVAKQPLELAVINEHGFYYATVPTTDFATLDQWVNEAVLSYHSAYTIQKDQEEYQVWLAIYQLEPQNFFEISTFFIFLGIILLFSIVLLLVLMMRKQILHPLKRLRMNILKLKEFRLSEVSPIDKTSAYDRLSVELHEFTDDLQGKMETIGTKYTALEKELQAKNEESIYKEQLVRSVIHDLKTPISIVSLELEQVKEQASLNPALVQKIETIEKRNQGVLTEIKEAILLIHGERVINQCEKIDLVKEVQNTIRRFNPILSKRQIRCIVDVPAELMVYMDVIEVKQLLHNIMSNIAQYTDEKGVFEFTLFEENQSLKMSAYNESADIDAIDFEHVFDLFYQGEVLAKTSTGVGMYTIKKTVQKYQGTCQFSKKENGVELRIEIPLEAVQDE